MQRIFLIILLGLFSGAAYSQSISITIGQGIYAAYGVGTGLGEQTVYTDAESRAANLSSATGMYRSTHGPDSLPIGTLVKVTYTDGSTETFVVIGTNLYTKQARPVDGTQKDKDGKAVSTCDNHCDPAPNPDSGNSGEGDPPGFWDSFWQWFGSFDPSYFGYFGSGGNVNIGPLVNP